MKSVTVKLEGFEQLQKELERIELRVANTIRGKALRAASSIVLADMRRRVPKGETGLLKKSLGRRFKTYRNRATTIAVVGPRRKQPNKPTRYAHLTEFGTGPRYTKDGSYRGQVPARPWMRPAFESSKARAQSAMAQKLREELNKVGRSV